MGATRRIYGSSWPALIASVHFDKVRVMDAEFSMSARGAPSKFLMARIKRMCGAQH